MAAKARKDLYANRAAVSVTMDDANTLTFAQLETSISMFEKLAWIIHRIEFHIAYETILLMTASGDLIRVALCGNNQVTSLYPNQNSIYSMGELLRQDSGTAANFQLHDLNFKNGVGEKDFSSLPGGGLIVPPQPMYLGMNSIGLASAGICRALIFFSFKALNADEYWELVEATRLVQ